MTSFLVNITNDADKNKTPIVLVDVSGSTDTQFLKEPKMNVRDYEFKLVVEYCNKINIDKIHLIC